MKDFKPGKSLQALVNQKADLEDELTELQERKRLVEVRALEYLIEYQMYDCFTVKWPKVARRAREFGDDI